MPPRLSPTERIRAQINELFVSQQDLGQVLEEVARLSVWLVMQAALEAEISEFLGRDRYARGERERAGYRNGHAELTVNTTAGPVVLERPKLRGTAQPFASRLLGKGVSRTNALEALVISGFVRGLSTRDVEAALGEVLGPEAALSKSTVSRICRAIKDEFEAWKTRHLGGIELEYLCLDGSHFRMHPGAPAEPVRCAWGITTQGSPVLLGLAPGAHEGHDPWAGFLGELVARGLRAPLLVITDGAPGLIGAVEVVFSPSLRQRCLVHRAAISSPGFPPTPRTRSRPRSGRSSTTSPTLASWRSMRRAAPPRRSLTATQALPGGVACLLASLPELTTFLRFPREHWPRIRHTNLIERTFGETRRRIKVIGRLPGERSCLSLVWAMLDRAARGWRGVVMTPAAVPLLQELRRQLHHPARLAGVVDQPVTPAAYLAPSGARVRAFHQMRDAIPGAGAQPQAAEKIHASTPDSRRSWWIRLSPPPRSIPWWEPRVSLFHQKRTPPAAGTARLLASPRPSRASWPSCSTAPSARGLHLAVQNALAAVNP